MNSSVATLSHLRESSQHQTKLGQFCGAQQLFRNRYRILRALGRGGFGVTFLAKDVSLPGMPLCVIKQLCPKVSNPVTLQRASERFEREAKTLSQLGSHAQVPQLLNYFQENGEFYLVQEYVKGCTLVKEVRVNGVYSELAVKRFLREILPVLDYVHQHQVIHRDIKPPNIIRCQDDGRLVLIDFGAVKENIQSVDEWSQKVPTTQFVGTVGFAPPEQLALRPTYSSDIYAIGITCLYLLTGRSPMEFEVDAATGEIRWQQDVDISDHFGKVLAKMLKIAVRDRYQSVEQVIRALNLEPYLDNLADCMNSQPPIANLSDDQALLNSGRYIPPTTRTAMAIRQWRNKLKTKQQPQGASGGEFLVGSVSATGF
ncbi:serine/threonine protein kinase [Oculatella sp. LEGE 06141]|uniref:serine/threonine-protein kinase n=1 Tax=Oculatella sp. LEGE 06141 TaxID=1828648 RepID=UPI0018818088|nr:serine/threonine-protein kinase [Oculatella sp. LEGE 06141]MBE9179052.1 serine/threonine protein kinase [Oculatella sp. LEGE 06141]